MHTRGDGFTKERMSSEMNEQIRNLFRSHHLQYAGVEQESLARDSVIRTFVKNDEVFV